MSDKQTVISKDLDNKKLIIDREFHAPQEQVWRAWTEKELLDQWWAPRPWKAQTKSMDFRPGGSWLYAMVGPDGTAQWCRADYKTVDAPNSYSGDDAFCDEEGNPTGDFPSMHWEVSFSPTATGTNAHIEVSFASAEDLEKIVAMGFKEGFTAAHDNLDEVLAK